MATEAKPKSVVNPNVMLGKPVVAGTRITVEHIVRELAAGSAIDDLLDMHLPIMHEQIIAAPAYAVDAKSR